MDTSTLPDTIPAAEAHLYLQGGKAPSPNSSQPTGGLPPLNMLPPLPLGNTPAKSTPEMPSVDPNNLPQTIDMQHAAGILSQLTGSGAMPTPTNGMSPTTPAHAVASSQFGVARQPQSLPIKGAITQEFGDTDYSKANPQIYHGSGHNGVDIGVPAGTPVPETVSGTVIQVGDMGKHAYGKYIVVQGSDGVTRLYGHLSNQGVQVGQTVQPGEVIGKTGATGDATGPHLHYSEFVPSRGK